MGSEVRESALQRKKVYIMPQKTIAESTELVESFILRCLREFNSQTSLQERSTKLSHFGEISADRPY